MIRLLGRLADLLAVVYSVETILNQRKWSIEENFLKEISRS